MTNKARKPAQAQQRAHCDHCHDRLAVYRFADLKIGKPYWCRQCFAACFPALAKLVFGLEARDEK